MSEATEVAAAEPLTRAELEAGITNGLTEIRRDRINVALAACMLRTKARFCDGGLERFFEKMGIPVDIRGSERLKAVRAWDGNLRDGTKWEILPGLILMGRFQAELYSDAGIKLIHSEMDSCHERWMNEARQYAIDQQRVGHYSQALLTKALAEAGLKSVRTTTRYAVSIGFEFTRPIKSDSAHPERVHDKISKHLGALLDQVGGEGAELAGEPRIYVNSGETIS